jgi:hypothetical protein
MKRLPNIWLDSLATFESIVAQIDQCLLILKENSESADFNDPEVKRQYGNDVLYMKQFFERAEMLARRNANGTK